MSLWSDQHHYLVGFSVLHGGEPVVDHDEPRDAYPAHRGLRTHDDGDHSRIRHVRHDGAGLVGKDNQNRGDHYKVLL